jgi:hypothetical protein
MTNEPQETYRKLAKTFRQAIQVKLKPIFTCQDNCGKARRTPGIPGKSQETKEITQEPQEM